MERVVEQRPLYNRHLWRYSGREICKNSFFFEDSNFESDLAVSKNSIRAQ